MGISWRAFWKHDYYEVSLHARAYGQRVTRTLEVAAFQVMHMYNAFTGNSVTVDELLGRGERVDLINDPTARDKLEATRG